MINDRELLQQYVKNRSEAAFGRLLERHIQLVYWTCRSELPDAQLCEDATAMVFVLMARKASSLTRHTCIAGWLRAAAHNVARNMRRSEEARRRRELKTAADLQRTAAEWREPDAEPLLTDALNTLSPLDRKAILLRYADDMSLQEVAGHLGTTADTARKRISRALDRLRSHFVFSHPPRAGSDFRKDAGSLTFPARG